VVVVGGGEGGGDFRKAPNGKKKYFGTAKESRLSKL